MLTSVVIPTLNRTDLLDKCVAAVESTCDAEIIVEHDIDREGFATVCNRGAQRSTGAALCFLNDDTEPQPGWLDAMLSCVENRIVGAKLLYPDGEPQHTGVFFRRNNGTLEAYNDRDLSRASGSVPAVTGACLALSKEWFDHLGGFDTGYRNGYEDVDLCLRARRSGMGVWYEADATVIHHEAQSEGRFDHAGRNIALLQQRWGRLPI